MHTIMIELRTNFDTDKADEAQQILIEEAKTKARELLTIATLLSGKRKPEVALQIGDDFIPPTEVSILDEGFTPSEAVEAFNSGN